MQKSIFADVAFHQPHDMQAFYRMHNVKRIPTGPHTPWPNRAEMGVRPFKKSLSWHVVDAPSSNGEKCTGDPGKTLMDEDQEISRTQLL